MEFRILGPVTVRRDGVEMPLDGSKQRTVLAALLLAQGRVVSDSQLSNMLWGDDPPATSSAQIYTYTSRLRKQLGCGIRIVRQRPGYLLRIGTAKFDYAEFEQRCQLGHLDLKSAHWATAAEHLRLALQLWHGPALANVTDFLAAAELPTLDEMRLAAIEGRIEADLALGRHNQLVSELTGLVAEYPVRERLRAQLMTALYRADRQTEAFAAFLDGRRVLADELGVDPGAALNAAYQGILNGDLAWKQPAIVASPAGSTGGTWTHTIPAMLPPDIVDFIGRGDELRSVAETLRLSHASGPGRRSQVLVTGMAGVGKTALAVRAAHAARAAFPDGELYGGLRAPDGTPRPPFEILGGFLRALGFTEAVIPHGLEERVELYRSQLASRRMLVLLDDADSDAQARPLLPGGADCRVIITSRAHLPTLEGVNAVNLDPLSAQESVDLLTEVVGADRINGDPAAAQIVRACGYLPLAIRIVGGRLAGRPQWPLAGLARRLKDSGRILDELRLSDLDVRASLGRSYRSLGRYSCTALRRLALLTVPDFPGWALAAMLGSSESTSEDVLDTLVDVRLLEIAGVTRSGRLRYRFHGLVRQFARERAMIEDDVAGRTKTVDRALAAWLDRAQAADRQLADLPLAQAVVTQPDSDYVDTPFEANPLRWFEEENDALVALYQQACRSGRHVTALAFAKTLHGFLSWQHFRAEWHSARQRVGANDKPGTDDAAMLAWLAP